MNKKTWVLISFLCFLFLPQARAFVPGVDRYELSVGGDFPLYTGLQARYNWSTRYYTKAGAGFAIQWFMDTHQQLSNGLGFDSRTTLLSYALINSVVFDLRMGWAMSIYEGPYIELGYKLMIWGKGEVKGHEIATHLGQVANMQGPSQNYVNILNHGPAMHIGYRMFLMDKLTLSLELGAYKPLFSRTTLNYQGVAVPTGQSDKVKDLILQHLWFLTAGLWVGVTF